MRTYRYTGFFINGEGHKYSIDVQTNGFRKALILLTADAIRSGRHFQLDKIVNENGNVRKVKEIYDAIDDLLIYDENLIEC